MTNITKKKIQRELTKIIDPELGINIVEMGLIYKIEIEDKGGRFKERIRVVMTLTSPGCLFGGEFERQIKKQLRKVFKIKTRQIKVNFSFDPLWNPEKMTEEARVELGFE